MYVYCSFICCESYFISHSTSVGRLSARSCYGKNRESLRRYLASLHVIAHNLFTPCCLVRARARFPCLPSQTTTHRSELLATMISNESPCSRANHTHSLNHAIGRCTSSSVARGRPAVTCRDRRQSDTAVSQLITPGLVHLLPLRCGIVDNDTTTHCRHLHYHNHSCHIRGINS